jgi:hypothetical protein
MHNELDERAEEKLPAIRWRRHLRHGRIRYCDPSEVAYQAPTRASLPEAPTLSVGTKRIVAGTL